jgi:transcriptional regulator with XRE-family HTH domain
MKKTRLPEIIGSALKLAREKRGMDRRELATQCCLSSIMIAELEEGGMTSFYSFQIKLNSAKRVASFLGLSPSDYLDQPVEVIEPVATQAEASNSVDTQDIDLPKEYVTDTVIASPVESNPLGTAVDEGEQLDDLIYESTHSGTSMPYVPVPSVLFKKLGLALGLVVVIGGLYALESKFQVSSSVLAFVDNLGIKKAESKASLNEAVSQEPQPEVTEDASLEKTQVKPDAVIAAVPLQNQCPPARDEVVVYRSPNPSKSGDSVSIKTLVKQSICVVDGQGKQSWVDLESNAAYSFRGLSPFIVSAQDLDNVEMFYQGWRVRPPSAGMKQLKLVETAMQ